MRVKVQELNARQRRRLGTPSGSCHYCPAPATTWDHIVARSRGGPWQPVNTVPACQPCNRARGTRRTTCDCPRCSHAWATWGPRRLDRLERVDPAELAEFYRRRRETAGGAA